MLAGLRALSSAIYSKVYLAMHVPHYSVVASESPPQLPHRRAIEGHITYLPVSSFFDPIPVFILSLWAIVFLNDRPRRP